LMKMPSRMQNGAVDVGNTDLILPVRVRTRTEDVDRTSEAIGLWRDAASAPQETGVAKRPVSVTPKGGALAWMTCEPPPSGRSIEIEFSLLGLLERRDTVLPSPAIRVPGAVIWRQGCFIKPVKSHVVSAVCGRVNGIYKAQPKGFLTRRICKAVSGSAGEWDVSRA
jgi:hypothetical protein